MPLEEMEEVNFLKYNSDMFLNMELLQTKSVVHGEKRVNWPLSLKSAFYNPTEDFFINKSELKKKKNFIRNAMYHNYNLGAPKSKILSIDGSTLDLHNIFETFKIDLVRDLPVLSLIFMNEEGGICFNNYGFFFVMYSNIINKFRTQYFTLLTEEELEEISIYYCDLIYYIGLKNRLWSSSTYLYAPLNVPEELLEIACSTSYNSLEFMLSNILGRNSLFVIQNELLSNKITLLELAEYSVFIG